MSNEYGEIFEHHLRSGRFDSKGREVGFIVAFRNNGKEFQAWVQNARRVTGGEWASFGATQRTKSFNGQQEATQWAYAAANERIAKL